MTVCSHIIFYAVNLIPNNSHRYVSLVYSMRTEMDQGIIKNIASGIALCSVITVFFVLNLILQTKLFPSFCRESKAL